MDEFLNPYRPGAGTPPPALTGRDELINRFETIIRRAVAGRPGKSLMVIGLRGVGKTVRLNRFCEIAEAQGVRVGLIEAPDTGSFPMLLAARLRRVLLQLSQGPVKAAVTRALGALKSFSYQLPDGSRMAIDVDLLRGTADSGDLTDDLTDLLVAAGEAAAARATGILLAIDEVQYLAAEELAALISAIHRTSQLNLPVVLAGAGLPQLPGLAGEAKSYAERLFDFPLVGSLAREEATAAVAIPARDAGVGSEDDALEAIFDAAQGYPYFLQEWGYHVWNACDAPPIRRHDVEQVAPLVRTQLDQNFFLVRFDRLTPKEKEYLRAMAELGAGPHRSGDIAAELGVRVETVAPRRSQLIAKGMIYSPAHGDTAFTVPLFDEFLRRTLPWHGGYPPPRTPRPRRDG